MSNQYSSLDNIKLSVDTEGFWDGVSKIYSQSDMTHHLADFELSQVLSVIGELNLKGLSCFGVADGNRDPIQILQYLLENSKNLPTELIVNDISSNMLKETMSNLHSRGWHNKINSIEAVHNPLSKIETLKSTINNKKTTYFIGVYNADYLKESLKLYEDNNDVIGSKFTICPLYLDLSEGLPKINKGLKVSFNINKFEDYMIILDEMKKDSKFYAYSVVTDKNFVSHYFDSKNLKSLISVIFPNFSLTSIKGENPSDKRYIVNIIRSLNDNKNDYAITMLNNVLGNIKSDEHILSLQRLYELHSS